MGGSRHSSLCDYRGARDIEHHVVAISCSMQEGEARAPVRANLGEYAKKAARGRNRIVLVSFWPQCSFFIV